jgi:hypothetical protein
VGKAGKKMIRNRGVWIDLEGVVCIDMGSVFMPNRQHGTVGEDYLKSVEICFNNRK